MPVHPSPPTDGAVPVEGLRPGAGRLALVTGVTGYIGGRLVPELLAAGFRVRALSRHADRLRDRPWYSRVEVVEGDASDPQVMHRALRDVDVSYYLLHSLGTGPKFAQTDRRTALTFAQA